MAYIDVPTLRNRLPRDGEGISDGEILEAIQAAIDEVVPVTNDVTGDNGLSRKAVANIAHASMLDEYVFPRDARRSDSQSSVLREGADAAITAFLKANPPAIVPAVGLPVVPPVTVYEARLSTTTS